MIAEEVSMEERINIGLVHCQENILKYISANETTMKTFTKIF